MVDGLPTAALLAESKVLNVQRLQGKSNGLEATYSLPVRTKLFEPF